MRVVLAASLGLVVVGMCATRAVADEQGFGSWTGLYGGGQIGHGWGDSDGQIEGEVEKVFERITHTKALDDPTVTRGNITRDGALDDAYSTSNRGVLGGVHVGGNLQLNMFVFGIEGSYDWSGVDGSTDVAVGVRSQDVGVVIPEPTPVTTISSDIDDIASIRGRVGIANDKWMLYGTAGWAWADASVSVLARNPMATKFADVDFADNPLTGGSFSSSKVLNGYVIGGGVEYMITRQLSLRAEVLHYDLGSIKYAFEAEEAGVEETNNIEEAEGEQDFGLTQVRAAVSVHFN